ncbi:hypothetical protein RFN28_07695 [Mesorhizobium sp. VK24D]|uniref:Integrase DNA-binding domain-containing protein n=1 Tax=Mesorhizobium album TaxID=3072314 RepID=A0ABU4XUI6_9HYPH|nr:hypothetical protein [Mesorhizobium sp. VK24D]MDX8478361.1 hypothetical protein [Mesorhizobium sp. VK24D]
MDVSRSVSPDVSRDELSSAIMERQHLPVSGNGKGRSPGRYLVRSGSVYLFQIRMPEDVGGSPARILRIGLGALTARQARVRAELLAALARESFEQVSSVMIPGWLRSRSMRPRR